MRKGNGRWVLWVVVFLMTFVASMEAGLLRSFVGAGMHPSVRVASQGGAVVSSGSGEGSSMLQFKAGGHLLGFQPKKVYFASLDHALSVEFLGTAGVMPSGGGEGREMGNKSNAPILGKVVYQDLWEGISLMYEPKVGGIVESTYQIGAGAEVSKIRLRYNVAVEVQRDGSLRFKFENGYLTESSPVAWQEIGGKRVPVEVAFRVTGGEVGFSLGQYDPSYPLTIDPAYKWHTFYGSTDVDGGSAIAVDGSGNVYVTGVSNAAWNGPARQNPLHAYSGGSDIFVLKLYSSGAYQWHTFYGSGGFDPGSGIAVDGSGNVYVTGTSTDTWNGPAGQSPLHAHSGGPDIFVLKLNSSGAYQWHTFYGSSGGDDGLGIAVDGNGNVYVTGYSYATWKGLALEFPLHAFSGGTDIFVLKLNSSGAYQWHTFYGSSYGDDYSYGIAVDGSGNVYVTGYSDANWAGLMWIEWPLNVYSGGYDIFVLKLNSSGAYQWHTFYGSSIDDYSYGIAVDGSGNVYVTGYSWRTWYGKNPLHDFSGYDSPDIFVLKLNSNGAYQWHTFYGSSDYDEGYGIAVAASGNVYVTGYSLGSWKGPDGQNPLHAYSGGFKDIFVLKLNSSGTYQWHTFYGSSADDSGNGIAVRAGNVYVTGDSTATWKGPAGQNPLHAYSGGEDIFVLKLSDAHDEIMGTGGTWSTGIWYYDLYANKWSKPYGLTPTGPIAVGDINGDGKAEMVSSWSTGLWYQDGATLAWTKVYSTAPSKLAVADITGDGRAEIIGVWGITGIWYWNPATSLWTKMYSSVPSGPIAAGDITGDGKADVVSVWPSGLWYQNGATLAWTKVSSVAPSQVAVADITGDGRAEIILVSDTGIWYWNPATSVWTQMYYKIPSAIAAGDVTGDGRADVVSVWPTGLYYQDGATLEWTKVHNNPPGKIAVGDITGD